MERGVREISSLRANSPKSRRDGAGFVARATSSACGPGATPTRRCHARRMLLCLSHAQDDPNPQRSGRASQTTQIARGARGTVALRIFADRNSRGRRAADGGGIARSAGDPQSIVAVAGAGACRARGTRFGVIVVDASALLEALLRTPAAPDVENRLFDARE